MMKRPGGHKGVDGGGEEWELGCDRQNANEDTKRCQGGGDSSCVLHCEWDQITGGLANAFIRSVNLLDGDIFGPGQQQQRK